MIKYHCERFSGYVCGLFFYYSKNFVFVACQVLCFLDKLKAQFKNMSVSTTATDPMKK